MIRMPSFRASHFLAARLLFFVLLACAGLAPPMPAMAANLSPPAVTGSVSGPAARIVYTADTLGYVHPCRTCGGASQGGLARRVALLPTLAAGQNRPLILAGPYEFYAERADAVPDQADKLAPVLHAAFRAMPYTAVYLSPAALADMQKHQLPPLPNGVPVADAPVTEFFRAGAMTAACVFLPAGTEKDGSPSPDQVLAAKQAAQAAGASANLVIAISPWGMRAENALAPSLAGYFHIILGGGAGIAVPGQPSGDPTHPGPLWIRSDRRGRAVNVVDIFSLPPPGTPWLDGINFSSRLVFLEPHLPQDEPLRESIKDLRGVE